MKLISALLLFSAMVTAGQAAAQGTEATLEDLSGKVLMNKGDGLVSGKTGTTLVDGDRIVTLDKSGARIVFPDGCGVTLEENMIFVINSRLGCKALPVASNPPPAAISGLTAGQELFIGVAWVGAGAIIGNAAVNKNGQDNQPISAQ
jgi:hypothetical protein